VQLLAALAGGAGMYFFCRQVLARRLLAGGRLRMVLPRLTAFFILWQGYPTELAVYWLHGFSCRLTNRAK